MIESVLRSPLRMTVLAIVLFSTVLIGQGSADRSTQQWGFTSTGAAVGRAGFAYLTGLRQLAAAVLWNRLDPQYHDYYADQALVDQIQMLPTVKMVTMLDPELLEPYYVAAWILARRGEAEQAPELIEQGLELAAAGVENNPRSGLLRVNYAQILWFYGDDLDEAAVQAEAALGADIVWTDPIEQHDAYAILNSFYTNNGYPDRAQFIQEEIERLDAQIGDALPQGTHDHDGDGVADH